jgi:hypothetical protein
MFTKLLIYKYTFIRPLAPLLLTACTRVTVPYLAHEPPADLTQPCPALQPLAGMTGKDMTLWIITAANQYHDCAARHAGLVQATRIEGSVTRYEWR